MLSLCAPSLSADATLADKLLAQFSHLLCQQHAPRASLANLREWSCLSSRVFSNSRRARLWSFSASCVSMSFNRASRVRTCGPFDSALKINQASYNRYALSCADLNSLLPACTGRLIDCPVSQDVCVESSGAGWVRHQPPAFVQLLRFAMDNSAQ